MDITVLEGNALALEYVEILAWPVALLLIGLILWLALRRR